MAEDYEPNLQLMVDQKVALTIAVGFMLENAVERVAQRNPDKQFLFIDSPLLNEKNEPYTLPNVRAVTYRAEEGCFLRERWRGWRRRGPNRFAAGPQVAPSMYAGDLVPMASRPSIPRSK